MIRGQESPQKRLSLSGWAVAFGSLLWLAVATTGARLPWQPILVSDDHQGSRARQLVFTFAACATVYHLITQRRLGATLRRELGLVLVCVGLFASGLAAPSLGLTVKRSVVFLFGTLTLLGISRLSENPRQLFQRAILTWTALAASVSLVTSSVLPKACSSIVERHGLAGVTTHPNTLGVTMAIGLIVSLGTSTPRTLRGRLLLFAARASLLLALVRTESMTSIFTAGVGIMLCLTWQARRYARGLITVVVVALGIAVAVIGPDRVKASTLEAAGRDASLSGRDQLWAALLDKAEDRPFFGSGFGAFWVKGRGRQLVHTWNPRQAHNAYLDVLINLGGVGLFTFLLLFWGRGWLTLRRVLRSPDDPTLDAAILAVFAALLMVPAFSESFFLKVDGFAFFTLLWAFLVLRERPSTCPGSDEPRAAELATTLLP
ncbi:MAG: O-antigen ligase family protein [Planctomycetota bacterium]|jgi:O-antigen ligase